MRLEFWLRAAHSLLARGLSGIPRVTRVSDWDSLFPWLLLSITINASIWLPLFLWLPGRNPSPQGPVETSLMEVHIQEIPQIPAVSAATTSITLIPVRAPSLEKRAEMPSVYQHPHPHREKTLELQAWLRSWQRRIMETASSHLPDASLLRGKIVVAVTVAPDGHLLRITVLQGTSHPHLVTSALSIIRAATPFPPLPQAWQTPPHPLRVVRTWNFGR